MTVQERIKAIVKELNLWPSYYAVGGSGVMAMHGIDRKPADVDLFVPTETWFRLLNGPPLKKTLYLAPTIADPPQPWWTVHVTAAGDKDRRCDPPFLRRYMHGFTVDVFSQWRRRGVGDIDVRDLINNAEAVNGVWCMDLGALLAWKKEMLREKDLADVKLIEDYLEAR